jgi:hypothetical protein
MNLLRLHEIASTNGDGLHPDLLRFFEERARLEADPRIVALCDHAPGMPVQAGPSPTSTPGLFVPGNVVRVVPAAQAEAKPARNVHKA